MDEGYLLVLSKEGVVYPLQINKCDKQEDTDRLVNDLKYFIFNYYNSDLIPVKYQHKEYLKNYILES